MYNRFMESKAQISQWLKQRGEELGFSMVGITPAKPSPRLGAYLKWVKQGMHGTMNYLARADRLERRKDLNVVLEGAQSLIVVAFEYSTIALPDAIAQDPTRGRISNYAWGVDYHDVLLAKLKTLASGLQQKAKVDLSYRAYVDTGAILERSHAEEAGLGFTGKNTMLIHPQRGSFFFLGEIITDIALRYDQPSQMPSCGSCVRCQLDCPTDAFPTAYTLDARRCISYLTIEHRGFINRSLRPLMGNWIYGCDICQAVCPWQRFAEPQQLPEFTPSSFEEAAPPLETLLSMDDEQFALRFSNSPIKRIKRERLVRNACIAAGNSREMSFEQPLSTLLKDESPLVRGHAAWALSELGVGRAAIYNALDSELDPDVIDEYQHALRRL